MLLRFRFAAVLVLCLPYFLAGAQGISSLIKAPPVPETIAVKDMPAEFRAIDIRSTASDFAQAMQMSMLSFSGLGQKNSYDLYQYVQTSWTDGKTVSTDSGEFLVTYRLGFGPTAEGANTPGLSNSFRLALVRKDSIIEISPRPDLTRSRLLELLAPEAQVERQAGPLKPAATSNMKQLALGMIMYSSDYDDVIPYIQDSKSAFAVTMPYMKNTSLT
ncbi:MAG: hypothetical protein ACHQ50_09340, partial [Fimbriimonadales bacterium]